jgi:hypothetical protein
MEQKLRTFLNQFNTTIQGQFSLDKVSADLFRVYEGETLVFSGTLEQCRQVCAMMGNLYAKVGVQHSNMLKQIVGR